MTPYNPVLLSTQWKSFLRCELLLDCTQTDQFSQFCEFRDCQQPVWDSESILHYKSLETSLPSSLGSGHQQV